MSELRRDPIIGRWNIIEAEGPAGPEAFEVESHALGGGKCPFCYGNEAMTPPEIYVVRPPGSAPNGPGWRLRVVSNKFPALKIEGDLNRRGMGVFDLCNGIGAHEVIIETPDHQRQMADLSQEELVEVVKAYQARSLDLRGDRRLKYTLIFKNFGLSAGASLEHTHSQLIALPIVPKRVYEELKGSERCFEFRDRCPYCDMLRQELQEDERIVCDNRSFVAICPFMSSFPFEVWILPKEHRADFAQIPPEAIADFARILKETLLRVRTTLSDPSYNFIIHTAPIEPYEREEYHWHLELIPKLTKIAGFEWGTGFYINPTSPELAAKVLRETTLPL
ncbi:MAG: galactose-1-phosphate uridylyltransferase [Candidatus Omnitrophica bacterium]|nr:galactose-1-phosphate uridylyltransferase [Candidatus Omnitrophota bacterium]